MALMAFRIALTALTGTGLYLLWGTMVLNGSLHVMLDVGETGSFPNGRVMKTSYTGLALVDRPVCILVAFFDGLNNLIDVAPYLMLLDLVGTLLVINMMTLVEHRRSPRLGLSPTVWQYLWNCAGVAVFLPIYSLIYINKRSKEPRPIPSPEAHALPFTAIWSLLLALPLMVPALLGASPFQIQKGVITFFLLTPCFSAFQNMVREMITWTGYTGTTRPVRLAYSIVGGISALIHVCTILYVTIYAEDSLSLSRVYVPHPSNIQLGQPDVLTEASLLFIQYDYIIIHIVVVLLGIHAALNGITVGGTRSLLTTTTIIGVLGPGAGLAFVLDSMEHPKYLQTKRK
ncbi:hypothetical protein GQX73_g7378 [Xylaria multiplex]|uniref:Uncharacterized protein n=1 Tax=Xylaria multiplex TaxID=323545 RepID=A0A7C8IKV2_9PEZI|nr:hypothetical protein GQX73_g7378 [Xylaria multiplex]